VQQVTKLELFINMKTARSLGLTVSLSLPGGADELMESKMVNVALPKADMSKASLNVRFRVPQIAWNHG
jgi:hypothetical protein